MSSEIAQIQEIQEIKETKETMEAKVSRLEAELSALRKQITEFPAVIQESFKVYDQAVMERINAISHATPGQTQGGGSFLSDIASIVNKFTGAAGGETKEINDLANKMVLMMFRKNLKDMERALGVSVGHVSLSAH